MPRVSLNHPDLKRDSGVLMWGENPYPAAAIYPDSNKIGIWTQPGEYAKLYRLGTEIDYYDGESNRR